MGLRLTGLAALITMTVCCSASAQWIKIELPNTPRLANGEPNLKAPAPRTADGKPDLSGIWQAVVRFNTLAGTGRAGLRRFIPADFEIPVRPEARDLWTTRDEVDLGTGRPSERCLPHTITDAFTHDPFKILQTPDVVAVLFEEFNFYRQIHTDGRKLPEDPNPAWFGYSVGQWDDDTLVVRTLGFKVPGWLDYGWIDDNGLPYSGEMHVTERFRRADFGHLHLDVTIEDPKVFTRAWTFPLDFQLQPDTELIENVCENEQDASRGLLKRSL